MDSHIVIESSEFIQICLGALCSLGLGDSIVAVMQHEKVLYPNVKVVSNFLNYESGLVNGFTNEYPLIHTFNKNETVLQGTEYYDMVHNRQHVILMGYVKLL